MRNLALGSVLLLFWAAAIGVWWVAGRGGSGEGVPTGTASGTEPG